MKLKIVGVALVATALSCVHVTAFAQEIMSRQQQLAAAHYHFDPNKTGVNGQPESAVDQENDAIEAWKCKNGNRQSCMVLQEQAEWAKLIASRPAYNSTADATEGDGR